MKSILAAAVAAALVTISPAQAAETEQPSQTTETFGAWTVRCVNKADAKDGRLCELVHVVSGQGGVIAQMAIGQAPTGDATLVVVRTPLGVLLSRPVELLGAPGDKGPVELPYVTCLAGGCLAQRKTDAAELSAIAASDGFKLALYERNGRRIEIAMPTEGLKAALARLGLDTGQ